MWELDFKESWAPKNWCFWTVVLLKTLESPLDCKISSQSILKMISPECSLEGLMLKLKLQYLATWCEELTYLKRPWCWERLKAEGEGDDSGWDGWIASPTQWTWVWVNSRSWWWTEAWHAAVHGVIKSRTWLSDWTELNWDDEYQGTRQSFRNHFIVWNNRLSSIFTILFPATQSHSFHWVGVGSLFSVFIYI